MKGAGGSARIDSSDELADTEGRVRKKYKSLIVVLKKDVIPPGVATTGKLEDLLKHVKKCNHEGRLHHLTYRHLYFDSTSDKSSLMPWQKASVDELIAHLNLAPESFVDCCSNIGADAINMALNPQWAKTLKRVTMIEIEPRIVPLLTVNVKTFGVPNVTIHNDNFLSVLLKYEAKMYYDVGYLDLPFMGAEDYWKDEFKDKDLGTEFKDEELCAKHFGKPPGQIFLAELIPVLLKQVQTLIVKLPRTYRMDLHLPQVDKKDVTIIEARAGKKAKPAYLVVVFRGLFARVLATSKLPSPPREIETKKNEL